MVCVDVVVAKKPNQLQHARMCKAKGGLKWAIRHCTYGTIILTEEAVANVITLNDVLNEFERFKVKLTDDIRTAIRIALVSRVTAKWPEDPLWTFVVGTSSSGKTLVLNTLKESKGCHFESQIHPQLLVSGYQDPDDPDSDKSLIPILIEKGLLVLKDYTELLAKPKHVRDDVDGILRGIYDRTLSRGYGHGGRREYDGQFNIIAGCTTPRS